MMDATVASGLASSATVELVNVAPDAIDRVVDFVATSTKGSATPCGDWSALLDLVVAQCGALLASEASDEDVESCVGLCVGQVRRTAGRVAQALPLARALEGGASTTRAPARFRMLCGLCGQLAADDAEKVDVLLAALRVGRTVPEAAASLAAALADPATALGDVDAALTPARRRDLAAALAEPFTATEAEKRRAQAARLRYLRSFDDEAMVPAAAAAVALEAAVATIRDPFFAFRERHDVVAIKAVNALGAGDADAKLVHTLLNIVATKSYADFVAFAKTSAGMFAKHGLSAEDSGSNMRLLSLCTLCADAETVPYGAVASALAIEISEVETWVVQAITNDLVECKIDQLLKIVNVSRCCVFRNTGQDWAQVQAQLKLWKANILKLKDSLATAASIAA